jgi:hypothetical protein
MRWSEHNNRLSKGQIDVEINLFQIFLLKCCENTVVVDLQLDVLLLHLFQVLKTKTSDTVSILLLKVVVCYLDDAQVSQVQQDRDQLVPTLHKCA